MEENDIVSLDIVSSHVEISSCDIVSSRDDMSSRDIISSRGSVSEGTRFKTSFFVPVGGH